MAGRPMRAPSASPVMPHPDERSASEGHDHHGLARVDSHHVPGAALAAGRAHDRPGHDERRRRPPEEPERSGPRHGVGVAEDPQNQRGGEGHRSEALYGQHRTTTIRFSAIKANPSRGGDEEFRDPRGWPSYRTREELMPSKSRWSALKPNPAGGARRSDNRGTHAGSHAWQNGALALILVAVLSGLGVLDAAIPASSSGSPNPLTGATITASGADPTTTTGTLRTNSSSRTAGDGGVRASRSLRTPRTTVPPTTTTTKTTVPPTTTPTTAPVTFGGIQPVGPSAGSWARMILDSEFSGSSLDSQWSTGWFGSGITPGINSAEQNCYDPAQVGVSGGALNLTAVARSESCGGVTQPYASGIVTTNGKFNFTYGYMEALIWMHGAGSIAHWPAFWADGQNWPTTGEIDTVEGLGGTACAHFHNSAGGPGGCAGGGYGGSWHTYAADWEPGSLTFYYDGVQIWKVTSGITSAPMYLILNLAVSSAVTVPATMHVDYVRVWQH